MSTNSKVIQAAVTAYQNETTTLEEAILAAITEASATCDRQGNNSADCAVAWDIVQELQAQIANQQPSYKRKTPLEIYCEENPGAIECLIYDV